MKSTRRSHAASCPCSCGGWPELPLALPILDPCMLSKEQLVHLDFKKTCRMRCDAFLALSVKARLFKIPSHHRFTDIPLPPMSHKLAA